jgi:hypothetical protein
VWFTRAAQRRLLNSKGPAELEPIAERIGYIGTGALAWGDAGRRSPPDFGARAETN